MTGHVLGICFLILIGSLGIWQAYRLPLGSLKNPGAGLFPFWISLILCGLGVLSLMNLIVDRGRVKPVSWPMPPAWKRIGFGLLFFTVYALILEPLGYVFSTILLMLLFSKIIFQKSWLQSALLGFLAVLASYSLFVWLLGMRLPAITLW